MRSRRLVLWIAALAAVLPGIALGQIREIMRVDDQGHDGFGFASDVVGDVDGDQVPDFLVGAIQDGPHREGTALLYSGATGVLLRQHVGESTDAEFGGRLAGIGDVDGDGVNDYTIGAEEEFDPATGQHPGKIYTYSGATGGLLWSILGNTPSGKGFGSSIEGVDDLDGDGAPDVLVGKAHGGNFSVGRIHIYSGRSGAFLRTQDGEKQGSDFGERALGCTDLDGDGTGDYVVCAPFWGSKHNFLRGRVYAYSGASGSLLWTVSGELSSGFGWAIGDAGDYDGDGVTDILLSEPSISGGSVFVVSGVDGTELRRIQRRLGETAFGSQIDDAIDVDGDGDRDGICAFEWMIGSQRRRGFAVFDLKLGSRLAEFDYGDHGTSASSEFSPAGDIDGDGFDDLLFTTLNISDSRDTYAAIFGFRSPPNVLSITPDRGDRHATTAATLAGSGFALASGVTVTIGGQPATKVFVVDDATLLCETPTGVPGLADVTVSHDAGTGTLAGGFAYTPAIRLEGDFTPDGQVDVHYLCDPDNTVLGLFGLPPEVAIQMPPFEGTLCISPSIDSFVVTHVPGDEFVLAIGIPDDPLLSGIDILCQALIGPQLGGPGKSGAWTNCAVLHIE